MNFTISLKFTRTTRKRLFVLHRMQFKIAAEKCANICQFSVCIACAEGKRHGKVCLRCCREEASRELNFNMSEALCDDDIRVFKIPRSSNISTSYVVSCRGCMHSIHNNVLHECRWRDKKFLSSLRWKLEMFVKIEISQNVFTEKLHRDVFCCEYFLLNF